MNVLDFWNLAYNTGIAVRKSGGNGLDLWQPLKSFFNNCYLQDYDKISVNNNIKKLAEDIDFTFSNDAMDDAIVKIDGKEYKNKFEVHHFFVQHFRIPLLEKEKLSMTKLMQIAYNAGQFKSARDQGDYKDDEKMLDFYDKNDLSNITTFIDKSVLIEIPTKNTKTISDSEISRSNEESSDVKLNNQNISDEEDISQELSENSKSDESEIDKLDDIDSIVGGFLNKLQNRQKLVQYYKLKNPDFLF